MTGFAWAIATFLLLNLVVALAAAARGRNPADHMLTALLIGTTGVGILAVLSRVDELPALVDVALVLALLAAISGIAFAKRGWRIEDGDE